MVLLVTAGSDNKLSASFQKKKVGSVSFISSTFCFSGCVLAKIGGVAQ